MGSFATQTEGRLRGRKGCKMRTAVTMDGIQYVQYLHGMGDADAVVRHREGSSVGKKEHGMKMLHKGVCFCRVRARLTQVTAGSRLEQGFARFCGGGRDMRGAWSGGNAHAIKRAHCQCAFPFCSVLCRLLFFALRFYSGLFYIRPLQQ